MTPYADYEHSVSSLTFASIQAKDTLSRNDIAHISSIWAKMAKSNDRYDNLHLLQIQTIAVGMNMKSKKKAYQRRVSVYMRSIFAQSLELGDAEWILLTAIYLSIMSIWSTSLVSALCCSVVTLTNLERHNCAVNVGFGWVMYRQHTSSTSCWSSTELNSA